MAEEIRRWARRHLAPDPHGSGDAADQYRVTSIYFDSDALDVFRQVGSYGRAKYRTRRYGAEHAVFLERKLKRSHVLIKRRTRIAIESLPCVTASDAPAQWAGDWFRQRLLLRRLRPVCQIGYRRTARVGRDGDAMSRLTLDDDVRAAPVIEPSFLDAPGVPVVGAGSIVEMKYRQHLPAVFKRLIEEFALEPERTSKYRLAVAALGIAAASASSPDRGAGAGSAHLAE
jgi:VTC domain-containing protein